MKLAIHRRMVMVAGIIGVLGVVGFALCQAMLTHAAPATTPLAQSLAPQVAAATRTGRQGGSTPLAVTLTLRSRNQAGLEAYARDVATPHARNYHQYLQPAQFAAIFGPDPAMVAQVEHFVQQNGLRVDSVLSGGIFIKVSGSVSQMEQAFGVQIGQYRDTNGAMFFANDRPLTVPAAIAPALISVTGLDNANRHHHDAVGPRALPTPTAHPNDACPATTGTYGLTPPQVQTAYGFGGTLTGAGEHVAVVEFDGYLAGDVATYTSCFAAGVVVGSAVQPRLVDLKSPLAAGDGAVEDELDIELILGLVPGVAKVDVYEAPNSNNGSVDMLAAIANDDMDATVSDSWGACEADTGFGVAAAEEMAFLQMATQGQGVYVAAGDTGAYNCLVGAPTYHGRILNADDPAADPYVTAVGGTTLTLNATTASYMGETVWNNSDQNSNTGTGGGFSQFWGTPGWQLSAKASTSSGGVADASGARVVPDISADADPQTGYAMYCTAGSICTSLGGWFDIGGTSAAAPLWAAIAAEANQQAGGHVGLITPALYQLYGTDTGAHAPGGITLGTTTYFDYASQQNGSTAPSSGTIVFHDVTMGNNTFPASQNFPAGYNAQVGYDAVTGLGSMQAQAVITYLANQIRFTAPRLYLVARGTDNGYWIASYLLNTGNNNLVANAGVATQWISLPGQTFQGAPGIADNGLATASLNGATGLVWAAGVGMDGTIRFGNWNPARMAFSGWASVPGTTCKGDTAAAYVSQTFFVACMTPTGSVVLNAYNTVNNTWGGWATVGGGLTTPPTLATDGHALLLVAQAPTGKGDQSDWYSFYTPGTAAQTPWYRFMTTCQSTPAVAYSGTASATYLLACTASDTHTMWENALSTNGNSLAGWVNLGGPAGGGLKNGTSIAVDTLDDPAVVFFTGQGLDNASYVQLVTTNPYFDQITGWQLASLPGIFTTSAATDYFGV